MPSTAAMAIPAGLEPALSDVTGRCFSQLNYGIINTEIGARLSASLSIWVYLRGIGDFGRAWTYDLLVNSQLLCQLSYETIYGGPRVNRTHIRWFRVTSPNLWTRGHYFLIYVKRKFLLISQHIIIICRHKQNIISICSNHQELIFNITFRIKINKGVRIKIL